MTLSLFEGRLSRYGVVASLFFNPAQQQRQKPLTPEEEGNVRWKETFYLNMLVQLEYELAVSICTKGMRVIAENQTITNGS